MSDDCVMLSEGGGGQDSKKLVDLIAEVLKNPVLGPMDDAGILKINGSKITVTSDGFVVKPIFFPGGDIGKLAVCGSVNDLAVMAAEPLALSLSLIIEEGFLKEHLARIIQSVKDTAGQTLIATGDTKVVPKGAADGIFVTTTGVGLQLQGCEPSGTKVLPGDILVVSGPIGRHGACIIAAREELGFLGEIRSDVAPLWPMLKTLFERLGPRIHACRDITRGGLATMIWEFGQSSNVGFEVDEHTIPVDDDVAGLCGALGLDPLILACEGRVVLAVAPESANEILRMLNSFELGKGASVIGFATAAHKGMTYLKTSIGGKRILDPPAGELLPRIC